MNLKDITIEITHIDKGQTADARNLCHGDFADSSAAIVEDRFACCFHIIDVECNVAETVSIWERQRIGLAFNILIDLKCRPILTMAGEPQMYAAERCSCHAGSACEPGSRLFTDRWYNDTVEDMFIKGGQPAPIIADDVGMGIARRHGCGRSFQMIGRGWTLTGFVGAPLFAFVSVQSTIEPFVYKLIRRICAPLSEDMMNRVKNVGNMPADRDDNGFYGRDVVSVSRFDRTKLDYICNVAHEMRMLVERFGSADLLQGKILANLFYEPSTRTSSSFMAAMLRLGGQLIPINNVQYSSVTKGESLPDTIRTLESYSDVIVIRHPELGAAATAARYASIPVINAGDGVGEHPTQALLDHFTIVEELEQVDGLKVAMVGDLKYGRTVHSLTKLLTNYAVEFVFVSPDILKMPTDVIEAVRTAGLTYSETDDVNDVIGDVDVLYVTRVQKERFEDLSEYDRVSGQYVIDTELMARAKDCMAVMHPLPRVNEISYAVDDDPRAAYFRQMRNGMYIRMALLAAVLGKA